MRTNLLVGALAAALAVLSSTSQGANLTHKARIESVQLYGEQGFHFTYARNDLGRIMALGDEPGLAGGDWGNLGRPGGVIARAEGVAATFETWGNDVHVFAVGEDGNLYEGVTDSSYEVSWTQWPAPSGKVLTGQLAAGTFTNAGLTYVVVAATTSDGLLYRWTREVSSGTAAWADVGGGGRLWLTTTPLAATSNQAQTVLSFFATIDEPGSGANSLGMHRLHLDGSATTTSQGNPGYSVCGSLSAAQGQITSTVYRLYVVCVSDVSSNQIAFAWADSATNDTLTWLTQSLSSTLPITSGNIAASVYRADGTNGALDMYYLGDDGQLRRTSRTSAGLQNPVELGPVAEASLTFGGMTAATAYETLAYSRVLYIGQRDDAYGVDAHYLYERSGRLPSSASEYQNYGAGNAHQVVASGEKYAEGMLAEYGGTAALAIMERPGNGGPQDWPLVSVTRSYNDYDTVDPITVLPTNLGGVAYNYIVDPTVGVTDQNRTYVSELAEDKNQCNGSVERGAAYLLTATRGSSTWTPILIRAVVSTDGDVPLDHPAMDIEHVAGGPDRMHVAWFMTESAGPNAAIEYAVLTEGSTSQPPHYIIGDQSFGEPFGPPRINVSDDGAVYVYTNDGAGDIHVCRVEPDGGGGYGCDLGWSRAVTDFDLSDTPIPGLSRSMRTNVGYSLAISPYDSNQVFLCYQREETDGSEKDIACKWGYIEPIDGVWLWQSTAVPVGPQNDNRDQFMPEVSVTGKTFTWEASVSSLGEAYVHFYDRYADPQNRTYRVRASKSINGGTSWYAPIVVDGIDYDPADLPIHCAGWAFIGDYAISRASSHHTHGLYVAPGGASTSIKASFRSLGNWWE